MEIHRFEKLWTGASLLLIVLFISTVTYGTVVVGVEMVDDSGGTIDADSLGDHPQFGDPGVRATTEDGELTADAYVVARQFLFQPGTASPIRVPADTRVTFHVTSADVVHGFSVVGTNVNTMVIPGQVAEITVKFSETGEYGLVCHEYCGSGHHDMAGTIQVVPRSQFFNDTEVTT
ncbi:MAG: cytochrome c oxidase subunit II [Halobacteriaceae archaeon]